jgi:hypothetical protein
MNTNNYKVKESNSSLNEYTNGNNLSQQNSQNRSTNNPMDMSSMLKNQLLKNMSKNSEE